MNKSIFLSNKDIAELSLQMGLNTQMDALIERMDLAFRDYNEEQCLIPARDGFRYDVPHTGLVEWMPLMRRGENVMMKMVGYHPSNPVIHKLPTILSTVSLFDVQTGRMKVMADGTFLTCLRTGAASAIASRLLANPNSRTVGLIGAGAQAMSQIHALSRIFELDKAMVYDIDPKVSNSFARRVEPLNMRQIAISVEALERVVAEADILCIATTVEKNKGPVFDKSIPLNPGLHINAVGSDLPGKIEVPHPILKRSFVCPDFLSQALAEGECQQLKKGLVGPELHELVKDPSLCAGKRNKLTVFDSTGFALEDLIALEFLLEQSIRFGVGMPLDLNTVPNDPYNSYEEVFSAAVTDESFYSLKQYRTSLGA